MSDWKKFNLDDFHISKSSKPYLFARLNTEGLKGVQPTTKAVFFPHKVTEERIVIVPSDIVRKLESDTEWKVKFPAAVEEFKMGKSVLEEIEGMPINLDKFSLLSQAIQAENETVVFYQNLQDMFPEWRDVLQDIINEELKHIGQFEALRDASSVTVATKVEQGQNEADAQMHGIAVEGLEDDIKYTFVELDSFKKSWKNLGFGDAELRILQKNILDLHNTSADLGSNLYKIRFAVSNKGKSSSNRTVYYLKTDKVYLIYAFVKQDEANISSKDLEVFKLLVKDL
jgi:hypothetical protein